jgi:predicted glycogen debranching enzyme
MDARHDGRSVTPRIGKPVEVNALWHSALAAMAEFAARLGEDPAPFRAMATRTRRGFARFWCEARGHCFDVLDGPGGGGDASLRPNQLLALSLPHRLLPPHLERSLLRHCAQRLLTSHGLRSLDPRDPCYQGLYGGNRAERDEAYHQGTAWAWWLGPFALAHGRIHGDPEGALSFLEPIAHHLRAAGLGSISEIFDGDAPHAPRGCIAQAWSVAEVLRAWTELRRLQAGG